MLADYNYYRQVLARHGIQLRPDRAQHQLQVMHDSGDNPAVVRQVMAASSNDAEPAPPINESLRKLEDNLQRLEQLVSQH